jgi:acetyl/propionyl-CoA carboxylase alpha subunit
VFPARHVEVQILADGKHAVALGERECSLQRRYQKLIEEGPAATISEATRRGLYESAVKVAEAAGYASAGTVEFLVGPDGSHYFLEVNTRLQVEHPVTELITGIDIVRAQVEIAAGGSLPTPPTPRGHAIEARLNAEDPFHGFLPQTGRIEMLELPQRPGVRVDAGVRQGSEVSPHYDSLIAKIIAYGDTREHARRRLIEALRATTLLGLVTNQSFLLQLLESDFFVKAETFTTTVEQHTWPPVEVPAWAREAAEKALARRPTSAGASGHGLTDRWSPWQTLGAFRMGGS